MVSSFRVAWVVSLLGASIAATACGDEDSSADASTGGSATTGGAAPGGAKASGGTGGSTGGATPAGGKATTSGGAAPTGGAAANGGAPPAGGAADTGGSADAGGGGGALEGGAGGAGDGEVGGTAGVPNEPEGPPILEQPLDGGYGCEVEEALSLPKLPGNGALVVGEAPSLFWSDAQDQVIRGATLDGATVGAPYTLHDSQGKAYTLAAARNGDRITLLWEEAEGTTRRLYSAQANEASEVVTEPHVLEGAAPINAGAALVPFGDGYAAVWLEGGGEGYVSRFARLDAEGELVGSPKTLLQGNVARIDALVALEDGFALAYTGFELKQFSAFVAFDAEGALYREPIVLGEPGVGLIRRGDYVVAAWSAGTGDPGSAWASNLRIGRFDERGRPVGEVFELQAAVLHQQNWLPAWVAIGDDLGLVWSRGGVIYICGGCIPDDHLEFVVLDGDTLARKSELVTIENQETSGGLLRSRIVASDSGLTIAANVTYHVTAEAGLATLTCTP
jgi:hypothetical protein